MSKPFTFDKVIRLLITGGVIVLVIVLIDVLKDVLLPFLVGWLIAYILEPVVQYNRAMLHLRGRVIAVFVTLFEITTMLCIISYFMVPSLIKEMSQVGVLLKQYATSDVSTPFLPAEIHSLLRDNINFEEIASQFTNQDYMKLINGSWHVVSSSVNIVLYILDWFLTLIYVVFIMIDYDYLVRGFRSLVPVLYRKHVFSLGNAVKDSMNHYFRGQALIAFIVAILYSIGFSLVGIPLAVLIGLTIGVLFMIPYMQFITIVPVTLLCLVYSVDEHMDFWTIWWECMAVYAVVQAIADLFLTPKIMGKAMGLNPAIILLSISVWGTLLGIIGLIIALPATTLLIDYYAKFLQKRERERLKQARE
ncbi:MAG: AI-2E family transporter [Muribaculaceae bacterium]|nr:AI-2E family transporter [Muribaculaceae bacterium]